MNVVATLTGIVALIQLLRKKPLADVFLNVYLFAVLVMPGWCRWVVPMVPKLTFHESAILPIAFVWFFTQRKHWKWSVTDVLVLAWLVLVTTSEYTNAGYKEAQNLGFGYLASAVLPYLVTKGVVNTPALQVRFGRRMVSLLSVVVVAFLYEFRFRVNPYHYWTEIFFPGTGWITTARYGFARAAGPFSHCILAGAVFLIGFRMQAWLAKTGAWESHFKRFRLPGLTKPQALTAVMLLGLVLTLARGPQIGAVLASVVAYIGAGRSPSRRGVVVLLIVAAVGIPLAIQSYQYAAVGRAKAETDSQESAAYRKELIDQYVDIAEQHALLGWGRLGWPKIGGMPSIDNHYLLLALMHGVVASGLFITVLLSAMVRLLRNGFQNAPATPSGSSLSFTLAGIFLGLLFTFFTVFLGESTLPIGFMMLGFAEAHLVAGGDRRSRNGSADKEADMALVPAQPRFEVVMA